MASTAPRTAPPTPRWLVAFAAVPVLIAGTGTAFAYWSATGAGSASLSSTTAAPLGITPVMTPLSDLYPGKVSDLSLVVSNSNAYPVQLTTLTGFTATSDNQAGCPGGTTLQLSPAVSTALAGGGYVLPTPIAIPAGSTGTSATLPSFVTMSTLAPDGCQGRTFTIALAFSGSQV